MLPTKKLISRIISSRFLFLLIISTGCLSVSIAQVQVLDSSRHLLRNGNQPEWNEFAGLSSKKQLSIPFKIENIRSFTLSLVQYDVKQNWNVIVNDKKIGSLVTDANAMRVYFPLPDMILTNGENVLTIQAESAAPDDILISNITLDNRAQSDILTQCTVDLEVIESNKNLPVPSRITIVDERQILQMTGTKPADYLAIRPGFVYSGTGKTTVLLPPGRFRIYAGRGFEYSVDSVDITLKPGDHLQKQLKIQQEVATSGWISADTHIHTLTHSGHGDASEQERAVTIAGEGIELPIITEHNKIVDFSSPAKRTGTMRFYTIVPGDEVTTAVGHFNVFPLDKNRTAPDHRVTNWGELLQKLPADSGSVIILNHARDIHNQFRPFDPKHHIGISGSRLDHWKLPANAMETVNSGALQDEPMRLLYDWFGMMNGGQELTPVGASDSHDVSRYLVGQARTYIRAKDDSPDSIHIGEAIQNFRKGMVMVSFGLLPMITVNKKSGPGEIARSAGTVTVDVEVAGPGWITGEKVVLYANGVKIREEKIVNAKVPGVKWKGQWVLPALKHDVYLVAVAQGSGVHLPFWPIVKPFQPITTRWSPYTIGCSGAVKVDGDKDGRFTTANGYAKMLVAKNSSNLGGLIKSLSQFDEAVSTQVAAILHSKGIDPASAEITKSLSTASSVTRTGFLKYTNAVKESKK